MKFNVTTTISGLVRDGVQGSIEGAERLLHPDHDLILCTSCTKVGDPKDLTTWDIKVWLMVDRHILPVGSGLTTTIDCKNSQVITLPNELGANLAMEVYLADDAIEKFLKQRKLADSLPRWVNELLHTAYRKQVNPLPLLRELFSGTWEFSTVTGMDERTVWKVVIVNGVTVWEAIASDQK